LGISEDKKVSSDAPQECQLAPREPNAARSVPNGIQNQLVLLDLMIWGPKGSPDIPDIPQGSPKAH